METRGRRKHGDRRNVFPNRAVTWEYIPSVPVFSRVFPANLVDPLGMQVEGTDCWTCVEFAEGTYWMWLGYERMKQKNWQGDDKYYHCMANCFGEPGDRRNVFWYFVCPMARLARVVAEGIPHHVTQRGNARRFMLDTDAERVVYLDLLRHYSRLHSLSVLGYCLMSNHVHLVAIPEKGESLAATFKETHGRYASYWNLKHTSSGHVWQGRFYSCPLDDVHLWRALRYTELNPVRAGLVEAAEAYAWSSAAAHCGTAPPDPILELELWTKQWGEQEWRRYLAEQDAAMDAEAIRQSTHTGRPLGSVEFVERLESMMGRELSPRKGGRKASPIKDGRQNVLEF